MDNENTTPSSSYAPAFLQAIKQIFANDIIISHPHPDVLSNRFQFNFGDLLENKQVANVYSQTLDTSTQTEFNLSFDPSMPDDVNISRWHLPGFLLDFYLDYNYTIIHTIQNILHIEKLEQVRFIWYENEIDAKLHLISTNNDQYLIRFMFKDYYDNEQKNMLKHQHDEFKTTSTSFPLLPFFNYETQKAMLDYYKENGITNIPYCYFGQSITINTNTVQNPAFDHNTYKPTVQLELLILQYIPGYSWQSILDKQTRKQTLLTRLTKLAQLKDEKEKLKALKANETSDVINEMKQNIDKELTINDEIILQDDITKQLDELNKQLDFITNTINRYEKELIKLSAHEFNTKKIDHTIFVKQIAKTFYLMNQEKTHLPYNRTWLKKYIKRKMKNLSMMELDITAFKKLKQQFPNDNIFLIEEDFPDGIRRFTNGQEDKIRTILSQEYIDVLAIFINLYKQHLRSFIPYQIYCYTDFAVFNTIISPDFQNAYLIDFNRLSKQSGFRGIAGGICGRYKDNPEIIWDLYVEFSKLLNKKELFLFKTALLDELVGRIFSFKAFTTYYKDERYLAILKEKKERYLKMCDMCK